ncbi:membrane protein insertase YidC [Streptomyces sp. TRM 70351]|uniref:membrane protein insertase YidC n=1 Tax=Streptomyces sp. TRM 70351 TaxID=3116552 RepID=UPI002E7B1067|nr:membrane protein insertase YidC [Streptomyces sp. TRM 70351]MEE1926977.1 membrane protein insertase YidC [Streptomyces sp. TRM 70351]
MSVFTLLGAQLARLAELLHPLFGASATAAAIVACTLAVRLALHPLARAAARGERARAALAPQIAELRRRHRGDPGRLQRSMLDLHARSGTSPLAGCLPTLLQLPVFLLMYQVFTRPESGLLDETLFGAALGGRWTDALDAGGPLGPQGLVYLALFAVVGAAAAWTALCARRRMTGAEDRMLRVLPLLSFGTLVTAAVVPLAAGLYLATTTAWTAAERTLLL